MITDDELMQEWDDDDRFDGMEPSEIIWMLAKVTAERDELQDKIDELEAKAGEYPVEAGEEMRKEKCKIAAGLAILSQYEGHCVAAEHDIIYAGPDDNEAIDEEDKVELESLGWFIDDETDSWCHFT